MDTKASNLPFSKQDQKAEFSAFCENFHGALGALFSSTQASATAPQAVSASQTYLWACLDVMYDYGFLGRNPTRAYDLGVLGLAPDSTAADAVGFFVIARQGLQTYLADLNTPWPELCTRTVMTATARHVLDGGDRYWTNDRMPIRALNLEEVALLANMDVGSVRNATVASKTGAARLGTFKMGTYTFVYPGDARAWLDSRPGFVPTSTADGDAGFEYLKQDFSGVEHLTHFLAAHATKSMKATQELATAAGAPVKAMESWLIDPAKEVTDSFLLGLAGALGLDVEMLRLRLAIARQVSAIEALRHAAQQRLAELESPNAAH